MTMLSHVPAEDGLEAQLTGAKRPGKLRTVSIMMALPMKRASIENVVLLPMESVKTTETLMKSPPVLMAR